MTIRWQDTIVAPDRSHHLVGGRPLYTTRFAEVLSFHESSLAAVRDGTGAFHVQLDGTPRYHRRFSRTFGFYEGLATVEDASGAHHVDEQGKDTSSRNFAWCGNFQGGACTVRDREGFYFHIGYDGGSLYAERWNYAGDFREGAAVVLNSTGLHHHIDLQGRRLGTGDFINLDVFHKGFARAKDERGWFHLRRDGTPAYAARFAAIEPFYNGQARCEEVSGCALVIDESGKLLVSLALRRA